MDFLVINREVVVTNFLKMSPSLLTSLNPPVSLKKKKLLSNDIFLHNISHHFEEPLGGS